MSLGRVLEPPRSLHPQSRILESVIENRDRIALQERQTPPPFTPMTLTSPWVNYGSGWVEAGFYRYENRVWLRGLIKPTTTSAANPEVTVLPVGYRPPLNCMFVTQSFSLGFTRLDIYPNGQVVLLGSAHATGNYASLENISFRL